jgi:GAF domain-containing protein
MDDHADAAQFLSSRRARISPEQAGIQVSGVRRVQGLRRGEVATIAGVSPEYYAKLERGSLAGVSASVLDALARALQLDDAERAHLFHLAQAADGTAAAMRPRRRPAKQWKPRAEEAQLGTNEGSCLDCHRTGEAVDVPDISTHAAQWPVFVETMRDRGLIGTFAEPIRLRRATIGSLCVFADHDQGHDDRDVVFMQLLADAASAALVRQRDQGRMQTLDEQVQDALDARVTVEQAKGALAHRQGIGIAEAFQALRSSARGVGRGLRDLADDVIHRGERLNDLT